MQIIGPRGLSEAAKFYARHLGIYDYDLRLTITRCRALEPVLGSCSYDSDADDADIEINPIRVAGDADVYATLAHEMIHLQQYVLGRLVDSEDGHSVEWDGKSYNTKDVPLADYYDFPWEIDAYGRQVGLYHRWKNK